MNITIKITKEVNGKTQETKKSCTLPNSWNELSREQQLTCYALIKTDTKSLLELEEVIPYKRIQLAQYLLQLDDDFMDLWEQDCIETYGADGTNVFLEELDQILIATDFLFDKLEQPEEDKTTKNTLYQIKLGLTKCPFPILERPRKKKGKTIKYFAPADTLENISIYELGMLFTEFENFMESKNEAHAHRLLAILYRLGKAKTRANKTSGYQGDRRLPLLDHESTIDKRMKVMASLPLAIKQLIIFWFASCRQAIIENNRKLFPKAEEGDQGSGYGWGDVILNLAGGLINLEKVSTQNYQNVFMYLNKLELDAKKKLLRTAIGQ